jgi:hypothetical protein
MQQLSPEKYILTKVRTLPIDKCMVNIGWQEDRLANVVVTRRHVTGNLTVGIYLVDLMCLGVKDSFYFFNITPQELEERIPMEAGFETISYDLAHNIVYAGHDFAMDFQIKPSKDFEVTKYILQEDDDHVPLLDVETGDKDGKPHLMGPPSPALSDALAKLRQHAGEGNYYYTLGPNLSDKDEDEEDYDIETTLEDFDIGTIDAFDAREFSTDDMLDDAIVEQRTPPEKLAIEVELCLRALEDSEHYDFDIVSDNDLYSLPEYALIEQSEDGMHTQQGFQYWDTIEADDTITAKVEELMALEVDRLAEAYQQLPSEYQSTPFLAIFLFEAMCISAPHLNNTRLAIPLLEPHAATCPLAALYLELEATLQPGQTGSGKAALSNDITDYLPGYTHYGNTELHIYCLIKLLRYVKEDNPALAVRFYKLAVDACSKSSILLTIQVLLMAYLAGKVTKGENEA